MFVVRTAGHSLLSAAGGLTYLAFFLAQVSLPRSWLEIIISCHESLKIWHEILIQQGFSAITGNTVGFILAAPVPGGQHPVHSSARLCTVCGVLWKAPHQRMQHPVLTPLGSISATHCAQRTAPHNDTASHLCCQRRCSVPCVVVGDTLPNISFFYF